MPGYENARRGLWQPVEFVRQVGAGVYFLEPYDPDKIPVLFVHGALGHPGDWDAIVAALDRNSSNHGSSTIRRRRASTRPRWRSTAG